MRRASSREGCKPRLLNSIRPRVDAGPGLKFKPRHGIGHADQDSERGSVQQDLRRQPVANDDQEHAAKMREEHTGKEYGEGLLTAPAQRTAERMQQNVLLVSQQHDGELRRRQKMRVAP